MLRFAELESIKKPNLRVICDYYAIPGTLSEYRLFDSKLLRIPMTKQPNLCHEAADSYKNDTWKEVIVRIHRLIAEKRIQVLIVAAASQDDVQVRLTGDTFYEFLKGLVVMRHNREVRAARLGLRLLCNDLRNRVQRRTSIKQYRVALVEVVLHDTFRDRRLRVPMLLISGAEITLLLTS